mgnify:CR=1 FL=1
MLSIEGLRSHYGRIEALHAIDLELHSGEIVAVVGVRVPSLAAVEGGASRGWGGR